jgi:hypothetical protein
MQTSCRRGPIYQIENSLLSLAFCFSRDEFQFLSPPPLIHARFCCHFSALSTNSWEEKSIRRKRLVFKLEKILSFSNKAISLLSLSVPFWQEHINRECEGVYEWRLNYGLHSQWRKLVPFSAHHFIFRRNNVSFKYRYEC